MPIGDLGPEIALVLAAIAGLLLSSFVRQDQQWWAMVTSAVGIAAALALCTMQLGDAPKSSFSGTWALDGVAIWGRLLVLASTALILPLMPGWFATDRRHGECYSLLLLSAVGAMLLAGAADLLEVAIAILLSSITGYVLAAYHRDWSTSVEAGMKYFLIGAFANTLLMIGVVLLYGMTGHTGYGPIREALESGVTASLLFVAGVGLTIVGLTFKMGAAPMHMWMPDVAEGAPAPAAAFLLVVPKIGGAVALARLVALVPSDVIDLRPAVAGLAVVTMTLGNLGALWQGDVRRLLGWSSVSQSGYALMAITVIGRSAEALTGLLMFLTGYAAATIAAFAVVTYLRGRTAIDDYSGLGRAAPWSAAVLILALLSLVGIPPLGGFVGKLTLFMATLDGGYGWLAIVAILNTVVSLFYYLRVIGWIYLDERTSEVSTLDRLSGASMLFGGGVVIAVGLLAQGLLAAFASTMLLGAN